MGLFNRFHHAQENKYSVEEAEERLFSSLSESTGWKFLKSSKTLKKSIGDLVFEIVFYGSKWNQSYQIVDVQACFFLVYKKYGKSAINNTVASFMYKPENAKSDNPEWYDISSENKLKATYAELNAKIHDTAVMLYKRYEKDIVSATRDLFEKHFDEYHVELDFVADILGKNTVLSKAKEIYEALSDNWKQQVVDYKNGARDKSWMLSRNNLKYIVDNELIVI